MQIPYTESLKETLPRAAVRTMMQRSKRIKRLFVDALDRIAADDLNGRQTGSSKQAGREIRARR